MFACIVTSVYSGISIESETSVQDIRGFLMILGTEVLFTFTYAVLFSLCSELPLLRKETGDHLYSLSAYYVSQVFINVSKLRNVSRHLELIIVFFKDSTSFL